MLVRFPDEVQLPPIVSFAVATPVTLANSKLCSTLKLMGTMMEMANKVETVGMGRVSRGRVVVLIVILVLLHAHSETMQVELRVMHMQWLMVMRL